MDKKWLTFFLVLLGVAVLIWLGVYFVSTAGRQAPQNNQVPMEKRFENKIVYTTQLSTDQLPLRQHCASLGGTFNPCGDICAPDAEICAEYCAYTCDLPSQETDEEDEADEQDEDEELSWETYSRPELGFTIDHLESMEVETTEGQDAVQFSLWGPTQESGTELFDGISLTINRQSWEDYNNFLSFLEDEMEQKRELGEIDEPLKQRVINGWPAYTFTATTLGTIKDIYFPIGEDEVLQVSYSAPDPTNQGYEEIAEEMIASLEITADMPPLTKVELMLYNRQNAEEANDACDPDEVLEPINRSIVASQTPITDTIKLLLSVDLTTAEVKQGFANNFDGSELELSDASLSGGELTLEFVDPKNFTSGGSCRVGIYREQIVRTAMQFDAVEEVTIEPEELFQP